WCSLLTRSRDAPHPSPLQQCAPTPACAPHLRRARSSACPPRPPPPTSPWRRRRRPCSCPLPYPARRRPPGKVGSGAGPPPRRIGTHSRPRKVRSQGRAPRYTGGSGSAEEAPSSSGAQQKSRGKWVGGLRFLADQRVFLQRADPASAEDMGSLSKSLW